MYYLGKKDEAIDFMNNLLEHQPKKELYYEAACLYSIMGDTINSLSYLEKALKNGYKRFCHIKRDRDLKNIRKTTGFNRILEDHEQLYLNELESNSKNEKQETVTETATIPFSKIGNVYKVQCTINSLPLHFIFDTGASDVSISNVEATFMLKNNYLKSSDIIGRQNYLTADGNISEGTIVNLRNVNFAGLHLENVRASVVNNQVAPLLLGQSVLTRPGKIEIDNNKQHLRVTYNKIQQ